MSRLVALHDLAKVTAGQSAPQEEEYFGETGVPFVRAGSLESLCAGNGEETLQMVTEEGAKAKRLQLFPKGTVLFAKSGMSATKGLVYLTKVPCHIVSHLAAVVPSKGLDARYLMYWLRWRPPTHLIRDRSYPSMRLEDIGRLKIPIFPIAEQKRIAAILDKADALRRKRQEAIRLTEKFLRSAFLDMFGDPVTNPRGWEKAHLHELCADVIDCPHATPHYSSGKTPYACLRSSDIQNGYLDWSTTKYVDSVEYTKRIKRAIPTPGDVVYCREGARFGNAARVLDDKKVCLGQRMMLLRAAPAVATPEFMWGFLSCKSTYHQAARLAGGSASPHVNVKDIKAFSTMIPPLQAQRRFSSIIRAVDITRQRRIEFMRSLDNLFDSLVQRAFRGELVPHDPNDQPASKLLERIRAERGAAEDEKPEEKRSRPRTRVRQKQRITVTEQEPEFRHVSPEDTKKKGRERTPVPTDRTVRIPIESLETDEVMAVFRKACRGRGAMTRQELLREVAQVFGYQRLGSLVGERLKGHLRAAIRRGIVEADGELVRPLTRTIDDYNPDFLIETLHSVMRSGRLYDREEVIRAAAEHLGFSNVTDRIRNAFQLAIRTGIRIGDIVSDRNRIRRF